MFLSFHLIIAFFRVFGREVKGEITSWFRIGMSREQLVGNFFVVESEILVFHYWD